MASFKIFASSRICLSHQVEGAGAPRDAWPRMGAPESITNAASRRASSPEVAALRVVLEALRVKHEALRVKNATLRAAFPVIALLAMVIGVRGAAGDDGEGGGGSGGSGGADPGWTLPGGTSQSIPAWSPCGDWSVRLDPIEETVFEGRGDLGPAPCHGAVHGSRSFWSGLDKARKGALAHARARDCHMHNGCSTSVPTEEQQDGSVSLTVDSGARRELQIRFTPSEASAPVQVLLRATGILEIAVDLEVPLSVIGCANAFGDVRMNLETNLPWPGLFATERGHHRKTLEVNANQCTGGGGGAALSLNGSLTPAGPAVGASVNIPLGPSSQKGRVFWRQKFVHACRRCVEPPGEEGQWTYALNAECAARVDLLEGVTAEVRARAVIEDLEFKIDQGTSPVACPSCVPTPPGGSPGAVGGGA
ncbi:MAG: hypothetical protein RI967_1502 [Planctomycetota bacterium]